VIAIAIVIVIEDYANVDRSAMMTMTMTMTTTMTTTMVTMMLTMMLLDMIGIVQTFFPR
jgi:hypothetical protein